MNNSTLSRHSPYRHALPQLGRKIFLADAGMETDLVFNEDWNLPEFASFVLLDSASGVATLARYYERYIEIARRHDVGLVLESPTWRASPRWGEKIGYSRDELADINARAIAQMDDIRSHESTERPIVVSGCIGPYDDGYSPREHLTIEQARRYHEFQVGVLADTPADLVCAMTMTYVEEAIGITLAAEAADMPVVISFTVETDGKLPSGNSLAEAIEIVDKATDAGPVYYMINCAHPTHFVQQLCAQGDWLKRIVGIRANASCKSHAELDESTTLDAGDPQELGRQYAELQQRLPKLNVLGGCCGTDHNHIAAIARHCV